MSDLYAVTQALEALNNTATETNQKQEQIIAAIKAASDKGGTEAEDQQKTLRDSFKDLGGPVTKFLAIGLKQMQDSAIVLEKLQLGSATLGTNTIAILDEIGKQTTLARTTNDDGWEKGLVAWAGLQEGTIATLEAAKVGLDLTTGGNRDQQVSNHLLRNQVALLDSQGSQGKVVLGYFQDLLRRGYTEDQARSATEHLAAISIYSLQSAQNSKKFVDQFRDIEVMENLFGGGTGGLSQVLQSIVPDVAQNKQLARSIADLISPGDSDAQIIARQLGPERTDALRELEVQGSIMSKAAEGSEAWLEAQRSSRETLLTLLERARDVGGEMAGFKGLVRDGFDQIDLALVRSKSPFIDQLAKAQISLTDAIGSLQQQILIDKLGERGGVPRGGETAGIGRRPLSDSGDMALVREELRETFEFNRRLLRDQFLAGAGEAGMAFRSIGIEMVNVATELMADTFSVVQEKWGTFFSDANAVDALEAVITEGVKNAIKESDENQLHTDATKGIAQSVLEVFRDNALEVLRAQEAAVRAQRARNEEDD
tara:strand:+ start:646 stop:2268 length:1623 start_codon:yes stop_codon:yes gene_type:complete